jgi:hypothetical protein
MIKLQSDNVKWRTEDEFPMTLVYVIDAEVKVVP